MFLTDGDTVIRVAAARTDLIDPWVTASDP
jgi:hypothetical protein